MNGNRMDRDACVIVVKDCSGSMGDTKNRMCKDVFDDFKAFVTSFHYNDRVSYKFISHTTVAEDLTHLGASEFFEGRHNGGSYISSGLELVSKICDDIGYYDKDIYILHLSDGDNWGEDNDNAVKMALELQKKCLMYIYVETKVATYESTYMNMVQDLWLTNCHTYKINSSNQINGMFRDIVEHKFMSPIDRIEQYDKMLMEKFPDVTDIKRNGRKIKVKFINGKCIGYEVPQDIPIDMYAQFQKCYTMYLDDKLNDLSQRISQLSVPTHSVRSTFMGVDMAQNYEHQMSQMLRRNISRQANDVIPLPPTPLEFDWALTDND